MPAPCSGGDVNRDHSISTAGNNCPPGRHEQCGPLRGALPNDAAATAACTMLPAKTSLSIVMPSPHKMIEYWVIRTRHCAQPCRPHLRHLHQPLQTRPEGRQLTSNEPCMPLLSSFSLMMDTGLLSLSRAVVSLTVPVLMRSRLMYGRRLLARDGSDAMTLAIDCRSTCQQQSALLSEISMRTKFCRKVTT